MDALTLVIANSTKSRETTASGAWTSWKTVCSASKCRENYECPAATVLVKAHAALEALVATAAERKFKALVDREWGEMAYYGLWLDPLKDDLEAFIGKVQERVSGTVTLRLFKGSCVVTGRQSPFALYNEDLASFDSKTFDQRLSVGNVQTHGMQSRLYYSLRERLGR